MQRLTAAAAMSLAAILLVHIPSPSVADQHGAAVLEEIVRVRALVHDVDLTTRQVLLEPRPGEFVTITAPEDVRNLAQLAVGDRVDMTLYGGIAASLRPAGQPPLETEISQALVRAEEGERPQGASISQLVTTVTFDAFDEQSGTVTVIGQSGEPRTVVIDDAEMRAFARTLSQGDLVDVTLLEVVTLSVD